MGEVKMSNQRMGEIAVAVLKYRFGEKGIFLYSGIHRDIGNMIKDTGTPKEELMRFFGRLFSEMTQDFVDGKQS